MKSLLFSLLLLGPAVAWSAPHGQARPTDMICRDVEETGSRLASQRVCMTRAQWEEKRRNDRQLIDRAQTQQINKKG